MIFINAQLNIPEDELLFAASRSSGPGGQNVNKLNTRITLWFDVDASSSLTDEQKSILHRKLATRINKDGRLWIVSKQHRTQFANREAALERFVELVQAALTPTLPRKKTRTPGTVKARRLNDKRQRSRLKYDRSLKQYPEE